MSTERMTDQKVAHDLDSMNSKQKTADIMIDENLDFNGMLLSEPVLKGLKKAGFKRPSPIQLKAIPSARCGVDLIVQAKSGTGKTCVFVVVALETIVPSNHGTQVLVLSPTREIARQSYETFVAVGCCIPGLKCGCFIGGPTLKNDRATSKQCHIVVGTPGRVCQLIQEGDLSVDGVRLFVLDEADKLMDESYQENVNWIFSRLPSNKQLMVLSATYPRQLDEFLSKYMKSPQMVKLDSDDVQLIGIKQYVYTVSSVPGEDWWEKKVDGLHELLSKATFSQCLIFCNYQDKVERLCAKLKERDWPVEFIAAQLTQPQRLNVMRRLKKFQCRILVSTDLTARGIDAEHVNLVINFDVPFNAETYFHRIGRAGRFGGYGAAITVLCGWQTEFNYYQMAIENNFRAKQLPESFPMDVVANETYYENLPPLKLPDMAYLERKVAFKNARKNVNLQADDFYGKLLKAYGYKFRRNDPDVFKFTGTLSGDGNEQVSCTKYDRDVFEAVLNRMLGVIKVEPKKQEKKSKSKNLNPKKSSLIADKGAVDMKTDVQIIESISENHQSILTNGLANKESVLSENIDDENGEIEKSELVLKALNENQPQTANQNSDGFVVSNGFAPNGRENSELKNENSTSLNKDIIVNACRLPSSINGIAHETKLDCISTDSVNKNGSTLFVENGFSEKIPVTDVECSKPEIENDEIAESGTLENSKNNVDDEILEEFTENDGVIDELKIRDSSLEQKSAEIVEPDKTSKLTDFDVFQKTLDSHLCYLYGGLSWHNERVKFYTSEATKRPQDDGTMLGNKSETPRPVQSKRVDDDMHDLLSAASAAASNAASNQQTVIDNAASLPVETSDLIQTADKTHSSTSPGRNPITYSRDALLIIWNDVVRTTGGDVRRASWYNTLIDLNLFVPRDFSGSVDQQRANSCIYYAENDGSEEYVNYDHDDDEGGDYSCPCWMKYEKVLKNYEQYVRNYSRQYGIDAVGAYAKSVQNFRRSVRGQQRTAFRSAENPLANSQRAMLTYYDSMLSG